MNVSKDNIAGFMLGISVGAGIGFILTSSSEIVQEKSRTDERLARRQRNDVKRNSQSYQAEEEELQTPNDKSISMAS